MSARFSRLPVAYNATDHISEEFAGTAIAALLREWVITTHPQVVLIGHSLSPSTMVGNAVKCVTNLASNHVVGARACGLPVIYLACQRPTLGLGVVTFAHSLLRQLIEFMPPALDPRIGTKVRLGEIGLLHQTFAVWDDVLCAIDILPHFMPPVLIFVIDNVQNIYDPSVDWYLRSLFRILLKHTRYQPVIGSGMSVQVKILITSVGHPRWLMEVMAEDQVLPPNRSVDNAAQEANWDQVLSCNIWAVKMSTPILGYEHEWAEARGGKVY